MIGLDRSCVAWATLALPPGGRKGPWGRGQKWTRGWRAAPDGV